MKAHPDHRQLPQARGEPMTCADCVGIVNFMNFTGAMGVFLAGVPLPLLPR